MAVDAAVQERAGQKAFATSTALSLLGGTRDVSLLYGATRRALAARWPGLSSARLSSLASYGVTRATTKRGVGIPQTGQASIGAGGVQATAAIPKTSWVGEFTGWVQETAALALLYAAFTGLAGVLVVLGLARTLGVTPATAVGGARRRLSAGAEAADEIPF